MYIYVPTCMPLGKSCAPLRRPFTDTCAMANVLADMSNFLGGPMLHAPCSMVRVPALSLSRGRGGLLFGSVGSKSEAGGCYSG